MDKEARQAKGHGVARAGHNLVTKPPHQQVRKLQGGDQTPEM